MTTDQILLMAGYVVSAFGGAGSTEVIRWLRRRSERQEDLGTTIRAELRSDNVALRADVDRLTREYRELSLANARMEGQVHALSDENTKLRNENLTQKGENAVLLARVEMFEKLLAKLTGTTNPMAALSDV